MSFVSLARPLLAFLLSLLASLVLADPPARVGRIAYLEGSVNLALGRERASEPATRNWPVSSGAMLDTGRRGRAEVWVASTAYRLGGDSSVEFLVIDDRQVTLQQDQGSLAVSIFEREQADDIVVHTPDGSIRFAAPGRYRIDVADDHTELTVQAGLANVDQRGRPTPVGAGQRARFAGSDYPRIVPDNGQDAFDFWVAERENATMAGPSRQYVSPYMTGYQDLDAYGEWQSAPEYGSVWYPRSIASDWAPYRFGRWAWIEPWGWTWIDEAPWGFAPFHYGRWVQIHQRWGWVPGRPIGRPVYAPALVGWIGNPGWSVSIGFGSAPMVGWFPLAPREVYVPAYRYSPSYVRQINVGHVHDVRVVDRIVRDGHAEGFAHRGSPRAVTVVPADLVRSGRPITQREFRHAEARELGRAPLATAAPHAELLPPPRATPFRGEARREAFDDRGRRDEMPRQPGMPPVGRMPLREAEPPVRMPEAARPDNVIRLPAPQVERRERRDFSEPPRSESPRHERLMPWENSPVMPPSDVARRGMPPPVMPQALPDRVPERDFRRDPIRQEQRMEQRGGRDSGPPAFRPPEAMPSPVREARRDNPQPAFRPPEMAPQERLPQPMRLPEPPRVAPMPQGGPGGGDHGHPGRRDRGDERGDRRGT